MRRRQALGPTHPAEPRQVAAHWQVACRGPAPRAALRRRLRTALRRRLPAGAARLRGARRGLAGRRGRVPGAGPVAEVLQRRPREARALGRAEPRRLLVPQPALHCRPAPRQEPRGRRPGKPLGRCAGSGERLCDRERLGEGERRRSGREGLKGRAAHRGGGSPPGETQTPATPCRRQRHPRRPPARPPARPHARPQPSSRPRPTAPPPRAAEGALRRWRRSERHGEWGRGMGQAWRWAMSVL